MVLGPKSVAIFLSHTVEQREIRGTTVVISPYVSIILCALLAYTDLRVEQKGQTQQGAKENQVGGCPSEF